MSRFNFVTPLMVVLVAAAPIAAQTIPAACKPVVDAERKQVTTPSHSFETRGPAGAAGSTEERILDRLDATLKATKVFVCHPLADETVGGVATAVYQAHSESDGAKSDGKIWIAKSTGLIVRQDSDVDMGSGSKMHISIRYEYTNVHAPAGAV